MWPLVSWHCLMAKQDIARGGGGSAMEEGGFMMSEISTVLDAIMGEPTADETEFNGSSQFLGWLK